MDKPDTTSLMQALEGAMETATKVITLAEFVDREFDALCKKSPNGVKKETLVCSFMHKLMDLWLSGEAKAAHKHTEKVVNQLKGIFN